MTFGHHLPSVCTGLPHQFLSLSEVYTFVALKLAGHSRTLMSKLLEDLRERNLLTDAIVVVTAGCSLRNGRRTPH